MQHIDLNLLGTSENGGTPHILREVSLEAIGNVHMARGSGRGIFHDIRYLPSGASVKLKDFNGDVHTINLRLPEDLGEENIAGPYKVTPHPNGVIFAFCLRNRVLFYNLEGEILLDLREDEEGRNIRLPFCPMVVYLHDGRILISSSNTVDTIVVLKDLKVESTFVDRVILSDGNCFSPTRLSSGDYVSTSNEKFRFFSPQRLLETGDGIRLAPSVVDRNFYRHMLDRFGDYYVYNSIPLEIQGRNKVKVRVTNLKGHRILKKEWEMIPELKLVSHYVKIIESITEHVGLSSEAITGSSQTVTPDYLILSLHVSSYEDNPLLIVVDRKTYVSYYQFFKPEDDGMELRIRGVTVVGREISVLLSGSHDDFLDEYETTIYRLWTIDLSRSWSDEVLRLMLPELQERYIIVYTYLRFRTELPPELIREILYQAHLMEYE